jgi:hypothetical protein
MPVFSKNIQPIFLWLVILVLSGAEFRLNQWEGLLIMFAALELVPRGLRLLDLEHQDWYAIVPVGLCAAYLFPGFWFLALPYLLWAIWLTLKVGSEIVFLKKRKLLDLVRVFALGYWATGATFVVFYLADFSLLGFDPVIVSLTGAHFHLAGFVLSVLVYCLMEKRPGKTSTALGWASLFGMPLVAIGITSSKLGLPTMLEQISALMFSLFVLMVLSQQISMFFNSSFSKTARWLWLGGATSMLIGIGLAVLYAARFQIPMEWINIPNMKLWHGTLNTLGFGWLSLLGWELTRNKA